MSRVDTLPDGFDKLIGRTELVVGEVIGGRFKLIKSLGSGGMGDVFVAENMSIGMRVAVKCLQAASCSPTPSSARASRTRRRRSPPSSTRTWRASSISSSAIRRSSSWSTCAARRSPIASSSARLPVERALAIAERLCWGLDAAHAAGVVHRDLKPANVLLAPDAEHGESPKLIDFGLAKLAAAAGDAQLTRTGQIIGTPAYMAPEQIKGEPIDARADVYALGCVLFEMLTGRTPFGGSDDVQILYRQMHEAPPPLGKYLPDAPPPLEALMHKALHKDPAQRFPSVRAMAAAIAERVDGGRGALGVISSARDRSGPRGADGAAAPRRAAARAPAQLIAIGASVIALVAAIAGGAAFLRWHHAPAARRALLVVTSQPAGARVTVDGRALDETTPTALRDLPAGTHAVRIGKSGLRRRSSAS